MIKSLQIIVRLRAKNCCEYCRAQAHFSHDPFSVDHIISISKGGLDDLINLAWACFGCNSLKYNTIHAADPLTGEIVPLFNPRLDEWENHFRWSNDFTMMIGKTPVGRATILRLQLNREGLVNLRGALAATGKHPPVFD